MARIAKTDAILSEIGGQLSEAEARRLILKKIYDIARSQQERYLSAEKRRLLHGIENLWDKYAVSIRKLELERGKTLAAVDTFLEGLSYV